MATAITLVVAGPESPGTGWQIHVSEDFDTVFDKVYPVRPATSSLEGRQNMLFTTTDGRRLSIRPDHVVAIEEEADES